MPSLNFYIEKRKNPDGSLRRNNVPIMLYFSYEGKRFQYYTGERCTLEKWDPERQRLEERTQVDRQVNGYLNFLSKELLETYRTAKLSGINPGREYLRNSLKERTKASSHDFFGKFMEFIDQHHEKWSIGTFRKAKTVYNHLRKLSDLKGIEVSFERIDHYFFDTCLRYFHDEFDHSNMTIHKNISMVKWYLNWATDKGYNRNTKYRDYRFPWPYMPKYGSNALSLDMEELSVLLEFRFEDKNLCAARDEFCFMCLTGIRYSELGSIGKSSVVGDFVNVENPGKTESRRIPLNSQAKAIMKKYFDKTPGGEQLFPGYGRVSMNNLIKLAGREAGLNASIELNIVKGDNIKTEFIPKWKALSTRVAVNTFVMNAFELGIPVRFIMDNTGIGTIAGMKRYEEMYRDYERAKLTEMEKFSRTNKFEVESRKF